MPALYSTRIGVSVGEPDQPTHVALVREPDTAEMLRTKGRLYVLVEVAGRDGRARDAAQEAVEIVRDEYYYDRSAGIEVSLRRAILQGNKRARLKLRGVDAGLHLVALVLCRNEAYAARVGAAEIFVVRRARLFVPGNFPGELTDYAYRGAVAPTPPFGSQSELLVSVWREQVEIGDEFVLAGARTVETIGADPLKNAALTLHPSAAAQQLHERYCAQRQHDGSEAVMVVEVAQATPRVGTPLVRAEDLEVDELTERIRERIDMVWSKRPRFGRLIGAVLGVFARPLAAALAVVLAFLPRRVPPLPRAADVAEFQAARRRRITAVLAIGLVVLASSILYLAYLDFQDARVVATGAQAVLRAEQHIAAAQQAAAKSPPDVSGARSRLDLAEAGLNEAEQNPRADRRKITELRGTIAGLREKLTKVLADLAKVDPQSKPASADYNVNGLYVADPGAAKVWRVLFDGEPRVLARRGQEGIGAPLFVATVGEAVYALDDQGRLFRYEGDKRRELTVKDKPAKELVDMALFATGVVPSLYLLDRAAGQVWKYEPSAEGQYTLPPLGLLAQPIGAASARSLAIDGDVWVATDDGQLLRFRRQGGAPTATRVEFAVRWSGEAPRISGVQAREGQSIYVLDAKARRVIKIGRDGRELERIALPAELPEPTAFVAVEEQGFVLSLHGSRVARTDLAK